MDPTRASPLLPPLPTISNRRLPLPRSSALDLETGARAATTVKPVDDDLVRRLREVASCSHPASMKEGRPDLDLVSSILFFSWRFPLCSWSLFLFFLNLDLVALSCSYVWRGARSIMLSFMYVDGNLDPFFLFVMLPVPNHILDMLCLYLFYFLLTRAYKLLRAI
jgi:hypothetical protein